jgi:DeoR family transcriptional regulator, suf operon transcriptional repressor
MTGSQVLTENAGLPPGYRGPKGDILVELKRSPGLTAKDLAHSFRLSLNAVRHHLKELIAEGVIGRRSEKRGVGAPVHVYVLTASGENLFPRRYDVVLTQLLGRIAERNGRGAVVEAMEDRFRALAERLRSELRDAPVHQRLESVARILGEEGYMAAWDESDGKIRLTEHKCAIKALAERFPEICEAEARFLGEVLAATVERQRHILTGCQACEYMVQLPHAGPDGDSAPITIGGLPGTTRTSQVA